jgi:hypothetical protein
MEIFHFGVGVGGREKKKERRERREKRRHTIEHDLAKIGSLKNLQDRL